jgi:hypothetical protein
VIGAEDPVVRQACTTPPRLVGAETQVGDQGEAWLRTDEFVAKGGWAKPLPGVTTAYRDPAGVKLTPEWTLVGRTRPVWGDPKRLMQGPPRQKQPPGEWRP